MPVDPEPSDRGNVMLEYDPREMRTPVAHYVAMNTREAARAAGWLTYVSHFATCPNASDHRSEKRPAARAKKGES